MTGEQPQAVEDFWQRHREFVHRRDEYENLDGTPVLYPFEMDVDDLIGAKGEKLRPTAEMLAEFPDPSDPDSSTPNSTFVQFGERDEFPLDPNCPDLGDAFVGDTEPGTREHLERVTGFALGRLVTRKAAGLAEPLIQAVDELREPLRTVAINHLYDGRTSEYAAQALGTSIETIEFLTELALDQLAARLKVELT